MASKPKDRVLGSDYSNFFRNKTTFLTGATGNLGGCLLYKLTVVLEVRRVYVLCRGSAARARIKMTKNMPEQIKEVLAHKSIVFIVGDIMEPNFGISALNLLEMEETVEIIINSAADVSLRAPLSSAISRNCMPPLELARMATDFQRLEQFIQISTAYCNSFLPDGTVEEEIYPLDDPESELETFSRTGTSPYVSRFPAPYYYSKHLMERLLTNRYPDLPLLLLRPSCIGEAIHQPCKLFGPEGSCPLTTFFVFYVEDPGNATWYINPESGRTTGSNIFDIIPVDWVANLVLLHAICGTRGIVHAGSESFLSLTFDDLIAMIRAAVSEEVRKMIPPFNFVQDINAEECLAAKFFKIGTRNWRFRNVGSAPFKSIGGPLGIATNGHDFTDYLGEVVTRVAKSTRNRKEKEKARRQLQ